MKKKICNLILFLCFSAVSFSQTGIVRTGAVSGLGIDILIGTMNTGKLKIAETPCSPVTCSFTTLPLRLLDFWGTKLPLANHLIWKTTGEENVAYYEIERSATSQQFDSIGTIASLNITSSHQYDFTDAAPLQGKNYYRLKMVDIDGKYTFSKIILLQRDVNGKIFLYPNPVANTLSLEIYLEESSDFLLSISDITGREMFQQNVTGNKGLNTWHLNTSKLPSGTYILNIAKGKNTQNKRIEFIKM